MYIHLSFQLPVWPLSSAGIGKGDVICPQPALATLDPVYWCSMKALRFQLWVILILETPFWSFAALWFVFLYNTALIHSLTAITTPTTHIIVSLNSSLTINCHFVCAARFFSRPCHLFCDTLAILLSPVSINTNLCPCSCQMLLSSDACCVYLGVYSPFILNARLSNLKQRLTGEEAVNLNRKDED